MTTVQHHLDLRCVFALVQALAAAHQKDSQAVTDTFQGSSVQIEEVGKALLMFKARLMEEAKAGHDRIKEDMRQDFNEQYNVAQALMQSKIQGLKSALADCATHDAQLNGDRSRVRPHSIWAAGEPLFHMTVKDTWLLLQRDCLVGP